MRQTTSQQQESANSGHYQLNIAAPTQNRKVIHKDLSSMHN
jgi:hypothetical protein